MYEVHLKWHGHFKKSRRFKNFLCFQLVNVKSVETSERSTREVSFGFSRWLWLPPSVFTKQLHSSSWRQRCFSCQCQTEKKLWTNQADIFQSQLSTRERNLCHKCNRKEDKASSAPSTLFKAPIYLDCCQVSSILASGLRPCFRRFLLMQCNEWLFCMREQHISDQYQTRRTSPTGQDVCVRRVCTFKHIWSWGGYTLSTLSKHVVLHTKSRMMMQQEPVQEWVRFITHYTCIFYLMPAALQLPLQLFLSMMCHVDPNVSILFTCFPVSAQHMTMKG